MVGGYCRVPGFWVFSFWVLFRLFTIHPPDSARDCFPWWGVPISSTPVGHLLIIFGAQEELPASFLMPECSPAMVVRALQHKLLVVLLRNFPSNSSRCYPPLGAIFETSSSFVKGFFSPWFSGTHSPRDAMESIHWLPESLYLPLETLYDSLNTPLPPAR